MFLHEQHNPASHPAGIVGSGALRNLDYKPSLTCVAKRTRTGLIASQKAVHAHPDHVTSWAVLAASVAADGIASNHERLWRDKSTLAPRISQFVELRGIKHLGGVVSFWFPGIINLFIIRHVLSCSWDFKRGSITAILAFCGENGATQQLQLLTKYF